jgi:hypothetical protein
MKNRKSILSVTIKRMIDDSPDTSWLEFVFSLLPLSLGNRGRPRSVLTFNADPEAYALAMAKLIQKSVSVRTEHTENCREY